MSDQMKGRSAADVGHSGGAAETQRRSEVALTDSQFWDLFDRYPYDPEFTAEACRREMRGYGIPLKKGRWPKYDVRVYYDDGPMGSGYLMVHWDDAKGLPDSVCLNNGYCTDRDLREENIEWDDQTERTRRLSVRRALSERAFA